VFLDQDQRGDFFSICNSPPTSKKGLKIVNGNVAVSVARTYWIRGILPRFRSNVQFLGWFHKPYTFNDGILHNLGFIPSPLRTLFRYRNHGGKKNLWKTRLSVFFLPRKKCIFLLFGPKLLNIPFCVCLITNFFSLTNAF